MKKLRPAERLIVAADFKPTGSNGIELVRDQVIILAKNLEGTGVCLKVNSALRACGYELISKIHSYGLSVFADLKLIDIGETLSTDGLLLSKFRPELLTVVCATGELSIKALKNELPKVEILAVTVLTSFDKNQCLAVHGGNISETVINLAHIAKRGNADGLICAPTDVHMIREEFQDYFTLNTPAIRPAWAIVPGDDQNPDRIMTPAKSIKAGADRIVVGRPIVRADKPYDAAMRTIEEIARAVE